LIPKIQNQIRYGLPILAIENKVIYIREINGANPSVLEVTQTRAKSKRVFRKEGVQKIKMDDAFAQIFPDLKV
jgi:hypothetical protein